MNECPVDDVGLEVEAGPLDVGDRDALLESGPDGGDDLGSPESADVAFPLKARFFVIDASGDVDGQDEFEIDLLRRLRRWRPEEPERRAQDNR